MTDQEAQFEADFIASCSTMTVTQTLPPTQSYPFGHLWARDETHHISAEYCGCADAKVIRNGQSAYTVCQSHRIQPLGHAARIRRNWKYQKVTA